MIAIFYDSSTVLEVLLRTNPEVNVATDAEVHMYTCTVEGIHKVCKI